MRYMLLIYQAEEVWDNWSEEERAQVLAGHGRLVEKASANKAFVYADKLMPSHASTVVRERNAKITITDGPFAETKEQLGGFYVLECKDLDEAIEYAKLIPNARTGSVEVWPVDEHPAPRSS